MYITIQFRIFLNNNKIQIPLTTIFIFGINFSQISIEKEIKMQLISRNDFIKVELRVGKIISAKPFPEAKKPAYILEVDFGVEIGIKKSSAQITDLYSPDELPGKLVVGVVNFPPKQIGPIMSDCLITGFHNEKGEVAFCIPDKPVPLGVKLF